MDSIFALLMWFGCPQYNALGGCGDLTAAFVVGRILVVLVAVIVLWQLYCIFRKKP